MLTGIPGVARVAAVLAAAVLGAACGCGGGGSDAGVPPEICHEAVVLDGVGPYFTDVTDQMGIGTAGLWVQGNRLSAGDVDGDGYPDLLVGPVGAMVRDDFDAAPPVHTRWLLLNRPDPADPARRVFADASLESGFFVTRDGGYGRAASMGVFGDVDDDGDLDVYSSAYVDASNLAIDTGDRSELMLNDGTGHFSLAPPSAFGDPGTYSAASASFLDFDADGRLDLFVGHWYMSFGSPFGMQDRLYRGNGDGTFEEVTYEAGLATYITGGPDGTNHRATYGSTACDVDSDGDQDILVSAYGREWNMLWLNQGDGTFVNVAADVGFDGDDIVDYSDNEFYRCYCATTGACTAPAPRIDCSQSAWAPGIDDQLYMANGNTFTTVCGDVDNDGDMDVLSAEIRHWHIGLSSDPSELLVNTPDAGAALGWTFVRPGNVATGLARDWTGRTDWNEGDIFADFFDFDADGRPDIFLGSTDYPGTRAFLFWQQPDGTFVEVGPTAGLDRAEASGLAVVDYDRDGDLDVIIGSGLARAEAWPTADVHVFRNDVGAAGNWLAVRLRGAGAAAAGANGAAIGARVVVDAGGVSMVRTVDGGYGHQGIQNGTDVLFGLGSACRAESVTITWPDAAHTAETFADVRANYYVEIDQGAGRVRYVTAP
jgi:hypothetical protein